MFGRLESYLQPSVSIGPAKMAGPMVFYGLGLKVLGLE